MKIQMTRILPLILTASSAFFRVSFPEYRTSHFGSQPERSQHQSSARLNRHSIEIPYSKIPAAKRP